jgi:Tyrosine phosphatase family
MEAKMTLHLQKQPNGYLPIRLGWEAGLQSFQIAGGPYDFFPGRSEAFGVCVRAERAPEDGYDVHLPIHDFDVPKDADAVRAAIKQALSAALRDMPVYVGCMGGWGRTGLFLALVAKAAGVPDPIGYVRKTYSPRAVETRQQQKYVDEFDATELQRWLRRQGWAAFWSKTVFRRLFWWWG